MLVVAVDRLNGGRRERLRHALQLTAGVVRVERVGRGMVFVAHAADLATIVLAADAVSVSVRRGGKVTARIVGEDTLSTST